MSILTVAIAVAIAALVAGLYGFAGTPGRSAPPARVACVLLGGAAIALATVWAYGGDVTVAIMPVAPISG